MKLSAKIRAKYLDQLLDGSKDAEYRQFETITLTDETGRSRIFWVNHVWPLTIPIEAQIKRKYPDVCWLPGKQIIQLKLSPLE